MIPTCSNCLHWDRIDDAHGLCCRYAPRPLVYLRYDSAPEAPAVPTWPVTLSTDRCGEHSPLPVCPQGD